MGTIKISLTLIFIIITQAQEQKENSGLLFADLGKTFTSYTRWHICFYYELEPYYQQLERVSESLNKMGLICDSLESNALCLATLEQLKVHLAEAEIDKNKIESFEQPTNQIIKSTTDKIHRKKRDTDQRDAPFEIFGRVQNALFGVLDARAARDYDEKIQRLQNDRDMNNELMSEQISIIKNTINVNQKIFDDFKLNLEQLAENVVKLGKLSESTTLDATNRIKVLNIAQMAMAIIMNHNRISDELINLLEQSIQGKITNTIPIHEIKQILGKIKHYLPENQKLPIDIEEENTYHIYKISTIRATKINNKILIELGIPILDRDSYRLIKTIPIPIIARDQTLILQLKNEYFLYNYEKRQYIPLPNEELDNCIHNINNEFICTPYSPIHLNREEICELNIFLSLQSDKIFEYCNYAIIPATNYVIQINNQDQYYFFIKNPIIITESCTNEQPTIEKIQSSKIIKIKKDCIITTNNFKLRAHNNKYFNHTNVIPTKYTIAQQTWEKIIDEMEIEQGNNLVTNNTILIMDYKEDYNKLTDRANNIQEKIRNQKTLVEINKNSKIQYVTTSIFTIIIITIIILIIYVVFKKLIPVGNMLKTVTGTLSVMKQTLFPEQTITIDIPHSNDESEA